MNASFWVLDPLADPQVAQSPPPYWPPASPVREKAIFVMPVLSAGATFAIGKAFIQHFESGGTLLDFNPPDYRDFVKAQKQMWDSRMKKAPSADAPSTPS